MGAARLERTEKPRRALQALFGSENRAPSPVRSAERIYR